MRVERSLLTAAAAAALALAAPTAAHADPQPANRAVVEDQRVWQDAPAKPALPTESAAPVKEEPKEAPKQEVPKQDAPKQDTPKQDTPKHDGAKGGDAKKHEQAGQNRVDEALPQESKKPHGGVHTGGGGLSVSGSGLGTGAALLLGGLGVGAYSLRRRSLRA